MKGIRIRRKNIIINVYKREYNIRRFCELEHDIKLPGLIPNNIEESIIGKSVKLDFSTILTLRLELELLRIKCWDSRVRLGISFKCINLETNVCKEFMRDIRINVDLDSQVLSEKLLINLYRCVGNSNWCKFARIIVIKKWRKLYKTKTHKWRSRWLVDAKSDLGLCMGSKDLKSEELFSKFFYKWDKNLKVRIVLVGSKELHMGVYGGSFRIVNVGSVYRKTVLNLNYIVAKMRVKELVSMVWVDGKTIYDIHDM